MFQWLPPFLQAGLGKRTEQSKNKAVFITGNEKYSYPKRERSNIFYSLKCGHLPEQVLLCAWMAPSPCLIAVYSVNIDFPMGTTVAQYSQS